MLGIAASVLVGLLGLAGILYVDRRRRSEASLTRREEKERMAIQEKKDRADLVLDAYEGLVTRVEEEARSQRALNEAMSARLDQCVQERIDWREERNEYEARISTLERRLRRAGQAALTDDDEDTPPPKA